MFYQQDRSADLFYREYLEASKSLQETIEAGEKYHWAYPDITQDVFTLLYEREAKNIEIECPAGLQIVKQALDSVKDLREYKELHAACKLNSFAAGIATEKMAKTIKSLMPPVGLKNEEQLNQELAACDELGLDDAKKDVEAKLAKLKKIQGKADEIGVDSDDLRQKMRVAIGEASKAAEEAEECIGAFGCTKDDGKPQQVNLAEKMAMAKRIGKSDKLKEIAKLAGRMTQIASAKQRQKSVAHEYTSVIQGDELSRILPSEYGRLGCTELKPLFFKDFLDKQLLQFEIGGKETKEKGPIICCVDGSGSMLGANENMSKAIAMALMSIAKKQKRDFILIQFSSTNQVRVFEAPKGVCEQLALLIEIEFMWNNATCFESPLKRAIEYIKSSKYNSGDLIFITDGIADISVKFEEEYKKVKAIREFSCFGILIGAHNNKVVMDKFCDSVFNVADLLQDNKNSDVHDTIFKI